MSSALARELLGAYATGRTVAVPPSARDPTFDLNATYAVEAELVRQRKARGRMAVGHKVGSANKALWRVFKLDTIVWAHITMTPSRTRRADTPRSRCRTGTRRKSSPRLCSNCTRDPMGATRLSGELVSTGTSTESKPIAHGETWTARVDALDLPDLTLHVS